MFVTARWGPVLGLAPWGLGRALRTDLTRRRGRLSVQSGSDGSGGGNSRWVAESSGNRFRPRRRRRLRYLGTG